VVDVVLVGDVGRVRLTTSGSTVIDVLASTASITSSSAYMDSSA
jgi:hypothetical protein